MNWFNKKWVRWENYEIFFGLRVKTYSYLTDDVSEHKIANSRKVCCKKKKKIQDYKHCFRRNSVPKQNKPFAKK